MTVTVECYAGYQAEQEPTAIRLGSQRLQVLGIADRWRAPDTSTFKVRACDGHRYLIRHDRRTDSWSLLKVFESDA